MAGGRPLKFQSVEELQERIDAYFDDIKEPRAVTSANGQTKFYFEPVTITGLALWLNTTRELLCNYEERDEFHDTVKTAKTRVENYAERQLYLGNNGAAGPIFALKNFGWADKQTTETTMKLDANVTTQELSPVHEFLAQFGDESAEPLPPVDGKN